jgi:PAS domain S-box-containing protein
LTTLQTSAGVPYAWPALIALSLIAVLPDKVGATDSLTQTVAPPAVIRSACEVSYPPFSFIDDDGRATGFSVELMQAAAAKMGREVTFKRGVWNDVRGWLEAGEVQALPLVGRTPERESAFEFTFPYMSLLGAIVVRDDSTAIRSFHDLRGKQVAVMQGDNMEEFLRREERGLVIRTTKTFEQALRELAAGQHDAVVIQRLVALRLMQELQLKDLRILDSSIPDFRQDFCFAVKFGDRETLALLNDGLGVAVADGTFRRLHSKWFAALEIPQHRRIVVGGDHNFPPFEFLDARGRPAGYNVDLTRAIAAKMGIDIQFRLGPWRQIIKGLEDGEIDVVPGMFYSSQRAATFEFTPRHLMCHYVTAVREGHGPPPKTWDALTDKAIVIQRGDLMHDVLVERGIDARITLAETQVDVLQELAQGKHDCAVVARLTALHVIREHGLQGLQLSGHPMYTADYCYAFAAGQTALMTQFTEGLAELRESGDYGRIRDQWLGIYEERPVHLSTVLKYIVLIAGPLLLAVFGLYTWNWTLRRQVARHTRALRQSERQFRSLVEGAPDAITVQADGRFLYLNPTACRLLGADTPQQLLGQAVMDRLHPDYHQLVHDQLDALMIRNEGIPKHEAVWVRLDGDQVSVEVSAVPITYQGQDGALVFAHDVTSRKQTEATLHQSQRRYRELIENLNEIVFSLRLDGSIEFVSPAVREMLGEDPQQLVGQPFHRSIHPDDLDEVTAILEKTIAEKRQAVHEFRMIDVWGNTHWFRGSARVRLNHGQPDGIQGVVSDITEQKRVEDERERLIAAIEQSGEVIMITDLAGAIEYVNSAFETVTGYSSEEALGKNPRILKSGEHDESFYRQMWDMLLDGRVWQGRIVNRRKDGSFYTVDAVISPIRDRSGKTVNFVGVARDVTEYIQRAAQLQQAQRMESVGQLAGGIAHDFNNLLSVILGFAEMALRDVPDGTPLCDKLIEIRNAGERAADLTRQLLAFGRKQIFQPVPFDLNAVVADMEKMLRRILGEDIDVQLVLDVDPQSILADPGQIEQVILNLAVNARDAMPTGGRLTIETTSVEVDDELTAQQMEVPCGSYVRLAVSDTGCGIDTVTQERVFEPFFTTKTDGTGTGLGLPTAYGIVKQSGGDIRIYSEPGKGTTFKIYLPRTTQTIVAGTESKPERTILSTGEHILVVEDEPALGHLLETMLTAHGYRVTLTANAFQALDAIQQEDLRPDLVLTDVIMPGMSGKEMADRMRASRPELKVLFMSGYTDNAIIHHGVLDPGIPFIHKPFRRTDLISRITDLLADGQSASKAGKIVLMLDDEPAIRSLVNWACEKRGHQFAGVSHTAAALQSLAVRPADLLLIDMNLAGQDGEGALRQIRAAGHAAPAVIYSGDASSVDMDKLRPLGAIAVVQKSHDLCPLLDTIEDVRTC